MQGYGIGAITPFDKKILKTPPPPLRISGKTTPSTKRHCQFLNLGTGLNSTIYINLTRFS